jgi:colanic acid/amylovoran biosynthesis glycosyltransferase
MKIGYVLKRFPRLSETFILNEILELERQGHQVEVFSLLRPPPEGRHALLDQMIARVTYLPSGSALQKIRLQEGLDEQETDLAAALATADTAPNALFSGKSETDIATLHLKALAVALLSRSRGVDHLHAHFASDATTVALLAGRMSGLPFSFTAHARDIYHTYTTIAADNATRRAKIEEAAFTVTVSDYNRNHLCRLAPSNAAHIHRLYNGIDLSRFVPNPGAAKPGLIVAVGRLIEKKGFADLVAACAILLRSCPAFRCRIIGDGPLHDRLRRQIEETGLGNHVEIAGPQPQEKLIGMMQEACLAVLPCIVSDSGDRDGLPTVLLEAMALGLPAITTTVSGGPEIIAHGKTGLLVEPGDTVGLAASIEALLQSPESMIRMGHAGRQRAEALFSLQNNVSALANLFADPTGMRAFRLREAV